ncbi:MAG: hypothetical protein QG588_865 [Candidatus Poribacteria bacterium]|nr:hypothetical protein [Candidatus Poribacteria bacterium]
MSTRNHKLYLIDIVKAMEAIEEFVKDSQKKRGTGNAIYRSAF